MPTSDRHDSPHERGFTVSHARDARWDDGLRGFFAYRDLGVATATGGRVGAHVIRARGASTEPGEMHRPTLEFQLVYVLRGSRRAYRGLYYLGRRSTRRQTD
jgi:hypothetical protein